MTGTNERNPLVNYQIQGLMLQWETRLRCCRVMMPREIHDTYTLVKVIMNSWHKTALLSECEWYKQSPTDIFAMTSWMFVRMVGKKRKQTKLFKAGIIKLVIQSWAEAKDYDKQSLSYILFSTNQLKSRLTIYWLPTCGTVFLCLFGTMKLCHNILCQLTLISKIKAAAMLFMS